MKQNVAPIHSWTFSIRKLALMLIILLGVFGPIYLNAAMKVKDYALHTGFAFNLKATGDFSALPHWMYYIFVIGFSELLPRAESYIFAWLAVLLPYIILGLIIFVILDRQLAGRRSLLAGLLTLALLSITPIFTPNPLSTSLSWTFLLGYVNPSPYHNPTLSVLKLWLIPVSLIALRVVNPIPYTRRNEKIIYIIPSAMLIILMTFTKPNYTLCLLPGLGLYALYKMATKGSLDWPLLILGIGLPAVAVLVFQYLNTFGSGQNASVAVDFLALMKMWGIPVWQIPVRLLLSIAFPLVMYILHLNTARRDGYLNLSWLIFGFGVLYMYTLHETGPRQPDGNFVWGAYGALFVLQYASIVFLIKEYRNHRGLARMPLRFKVSGTFFVLQIIFGIIFAISFLLGAPT